MGHQNTTSSNATSQNAATDPAAPSVSQGGAGQPGEQAKSYTAPDVSDASLAPPAAGEIADDMDEGDSLRADGVQQGGTNLNRPYRTEKQSSQGPETVAANRERVKGEGGQVG